jgi:hypothetical protein
MKLSKFFNRFVRYLCGQHRNAPFKLGFYAMWLLFTLLFKRPKGHFTLLAKHLRIKI